MDGTMQFQKKIRLYKHDAAYLHGVVGTLSLLVP